MEPDDHLFRRESGRMVAALSRIFGIHNLALAEDVVQDAFCRALEVWKLRGIPENPSAWLMAAAKNRALDVLRRERTARSFAPEFGRLFESEWTLAPAVEELLEPNAVKDDLLRMMFSCCQPRLPEAAQVAVMLHILCGFGIDEIAGAFVSTHAAIGKRITRAKKVLAGSKHLFDLGDQAAFAARARSVRRALYLLFNEGYHGASAEAAVRQDLCREAMRLTGVLLEHRLGREPAGFALAALMRLHAARLPSRVDNAGELVALADQDRTKWDRQLISEGLRLLDLSASGPELTEYHLEAAIAAIHASASSAGDTDWRKIVSLYDRLIEHQPSAVVALNRAIAVGQRDGAEAGLSCIRAIEDAKRLAAYPFYHAALGEFECRAGRPERAQEHFRAALAQARNPMERRFLTQRMSAVSGEQAGTGVASRNRTSRRSAMVK